MDRKIQRYTETYRDIQRYTHDRWTEGQADKRTNGQMEKKQINQ